ncbi:MAG: hypothetical protein M1819_005400 [Sarea resinae]|nr:MAG: hypothetical protein M1819_005400 [Sarea resinae]
MPSGQPATGGFQTWNVAIRATCLETRKRPQVGWRASLSQNGITIFEQEKKGSKQRLRQRKAEARQAGMVAATAVGLDAATAVAAGAAPAAARISSGGTEATAAEAAAVVIQAATEAMKRLEGGRSRGIQSWEFRKHLLTVEAAPDGTGRNEHVSDENISTPKK